MTNSSLKKVFILLQFGEPHEWTQEFFDNIKKVGGNWHWMIFTPNDYKSEGNLHIVKFTLDDFNALVKEKCGIEVDNWMVDGRPKKLTSDYTPAFGKIFEDYIREYDFWGHTNWDMVYGNIQYFLPDAELEDCDIWADDMDNINGIFTVYRNNEKVNTLYKTIDGYENMFTDHNLFGVDEIHFIHAVHKSDLRFKYPKYAPYFSYDRLEQHRPEPKLERGPDNTLFEVFKDTVTGDRLKKPIMSYHFSYTKKWPQIS